MNNEQLIKDYTEQQLLDFNHTTIRQIAKLWNIKSPTSKNKGVLISLILQCQDGTVDTLMLANAGGAGRKNKKDLFDEIVSSCEDQPLPQQFLRQPIIDELPHTSSANDFPPPNNQLPSQEVGGVLQIMNDGYGFLRVDNYGQSERDIYVPTQQIQRFGLRQGDYLTGKARVYSNTRQPSLIFLETINDVKCTDVGRRPNFDELTPTYPIDRLRLEGANNRNDYSLRAIDLVAPIGKGQRALIVSPPKAGKTILLKKIAQALVANYTDLKVIVLLIDERPEEVTDMKESVNAEVACSTFDQLPEHHIDVAELVFKRARRMVEQGQDVVILLDSITRLARAYNQTAQQTGRTLSGGLDVAALIEPKKYFGSGRKIKDGGSLTIIATALVDTGSKMDDIIYEEFKGTGNMEVHLDRKMSERRIFPAIDLNASGTRREDLLLTQKELEGMFLLRKAYSREDSSRVTEQIIDMLMHTKNNDEFIDQLKILKF